MLLIDDQHHATRHESYHRVVQRLETIAGVQRAAQWRCDFEPATQEVTIHSLAVRRGEAVNEHTEASRLRFLQREENLERYMLDGVVSVVVLLEDVRVGDVVETSYTVRTKARVFPHNFARITPVPLEYYTRLFHLSVRFPNGHGMQWKTDSEKITLNERAVDEGETEWSWKVENFAPRQPEPEMPSWYFHGRIIQFSDFSSWKSIAEGVMAAWKENFEHPALVQSANEIAAEPTLEKRVERALRLVQDEIRYLSVNTELGGQVPTESGAVLQRRFGDCKDKSFLLVHLLRRLGVPARPVLVHGQFCHRIDQFLPMPAAFNHAIIEYELDGKRRWVDATIPLQGGGPTGRALPVFGMGLPIGPDVQGLERIEADPECHGSHDLLESFRLQSSASQLHLFISATLTGSHADGLRQALSFNGSTATAAARQKFYEKLYPAAERHTDFEWRDDRDRNEIVLAEAYVLPNLLVAAPQPGVLGFRVHIHGIQAVLGFHDSERRKHPLALPFPNTIAHRVEFAFETLFQMNTVRETTRTEAFSFELFGSWTNMRTSFDYAVATHADHVPTKYFAFHRTKAHNCLAFTQLTVMLPADRRFTRVRNSSESLLPPAVPKSPTAEEETASRTQIAPASGVIASCLASLPPKASSEQSPESKKSATEGTEKREEQSVPSADSELPESESKSGSQKRRGSRRRSVKSGLPMKDIIGSVVAAVALGLFLLLFLLRFVLRVFGSMPD